MARPIKLRDFLKRLKELDPAIECSTKRGKGSHLLLWKQTPDGKISYPLPTSSGEVVGPYQKGVLRRFGLPDDGFSR